MFNWKEPRRGDIRPVYTRVVKERRIGDTPWSYTYPTDTDTVQETTVVGPFNTIVVHYRTVGDDPVIDRRTVSERDGEQMRELEKDETTEYAQIAFVDWPHLNPAALPRVRLVTRNGKLWQTEHTYSPDNYGDYGQPVYTKETGDGGLIRETTRTLKHDFTPWIRGVLLEEKVEVDDREFVTSFIYHADTGFRTSQTVYGVTTMFEPTADGRGNLGATIHQHIASCANASRN